MAEAIRVLHFADLHIGMENYGQIDPKTGVNERVLDFIRRLKEIVDYALENDADLVIFAGDAFKTRDPNPTYLREFGRQIMRLSRANLPMVALVGNHDMPLMDKRANSLDVFRTLDVPNVIVGSREHLHRIQTKRGVVQVATVPWPLRSRLIQLDADGNYRRMNVEQLDRELEKLVEEEIQQLAKEADPTLPLILTGHFTVSGATFGSERGVMVGRDAVISIAALSHPNIDYVALGHIHKHQSLNAEQKPPIVYAGSLERIDFGEEREHKGFCWINLQRGNTIWQFIPIKVRRFLTIDVDATKDSESPTEAVLRAIERHDVADAVVRVRVKLNGPQEIHFKPKEVENALSAAKFVAGIAREVQRDNRTRIGIANPEAKSPIELLDAYFISKNIAQDRANELLQLAKEMLGEDVTR
ncbi:MAG: exonuclease SbcCD subunit D [Chloroflexi bacterium]|jgi:exonuclease SbcD|nr:exonuclease SbcCD subunit D [Chloroflexota bacterium]